MTVHNRFGNKRERAFQVCTVSVNLERKRIAGDKKKEESFGGETNSN